MPPGVSTAPAENAESTEGIYDDDIEVFLREYVREEEMFADDNLSFAVNQGNVIVTGEVDSREELKALQTRIRRVPGVGQAERDRHSGR